jgi:hypothetical protein
MTNSNPRFITRYVIHQTRMASWVEDYDSGVRLEGLGAAFRAVNRVKDYLAAEFPCKTIPESAFEYQPGSSSWSLHIPLRRDVCLASEQVALITGLSRMMILDGCHPIPEDFTAPTCVIDAVTEALTRALYRELSEARANRRHPNGDELSNIISMAIISACNDAICDAVDALDGITPDCEREFILFALRGRSETGPPDPFSSKSRFRNDLMEAVIWWTLPKNDFAQKRADQVTMSDLAYYFSLAGYFDEPKGSPAEQNSDNHPEPGMTGGDERTVRRWMRKYTESPSTWPKLRTSLIKTIRRTGYPLP